MAIAFAAATILIVLIFVGVYQVAVNGEAFKAATSILKENESVQEKIGEIKEAKLALWGYSVKYAGSSGRADMEIYLIGERKNAKASISIEQSAGNWKLKNGNIKVDDSNESFHIVP